MAKTRLFKNSQWRVNQYGDLISDKNYYQISKSTLRSIDWVDHMSEKSWCDLTLFKQAYNIALQNTTNNGQGTTIL